MLTMISVRKISPILIAIQFDGTAECGNKIIELTQHTTTKAKWLNSNLPFESNNWSVNKNLDNNDWTILKEVKENKKFVLEINNIVQDINVGDWLVDNPDYSFEIVSKEDFKDNYEWA